MQTSETRSRPPPHAADGMQFSPIQAGKRIRIVQPAYGVDPEAVARLRPVLESRGLILEDLPERDGFGKLSGDDVCRAQELNAAFADPDVGAILVGHGGYGCLRLLDRLDWEQIARNPKPIVGFSDATALLMPLASSIGSNAVHGPTARSLARDSDETTMAALAAVLAGDWTAYNGCLAAQAAGTEVLRPGQARGRLFGGNLSLLSALCGTAFGIDGRDAILFLEEWNEPQYRFDRMLTQLRLADVFDHLSGVVLGHLLDIKRVGEDLAEDLESRFLELIPEEIPVISRFPAGHGPTNLPLLQGAIYDLTDDSLQLSSRTR